MDKSAFSPTKTTPLLRLSAYVKKVKVRGDVRDGSREV